MRVILSSYTPDPTLAIARAAKTCYSDGDYEIITGKVEDKDSREKMIKNIIDSGHGSCLEHAVFTFFVEGISRACTHQLVRHRIASYEQRSQRYVNEDGFKYVMPTSVVFPTATSVFKAAMDNIKATYKTLIELGVPQEDARYVLPNACTSTIVITMNLRSLRNFWELRMCNRAQWEIQDLAKCMYDLVKKVDPILVYKAGPKCITSVCTEVKKTPNCPYKYKAPSDFSDNERLSRALEETIRNGFKPTPTTTQSPEETEEPNTHLDFSKVGLDDEENIDDLVESIELEPDSIVEAITDWVISRDTEKDEIPKEKSQDHIDFTPNANIDPNEWWDKWNKGVAEEDEDDVESPDFGKIDMSKFMKGSVLTPDSNKNG